MQHGSMTRRTRVTAGMAALALGLAACGGGDEPATSDDGDAAEAPNDGTGAGDGGTSGGDAMQNEDLGALPAEAADAATLCAVIGQQVGTVLGASEPKDVRDTPSGFVCSWLYGDGDLLLISWEKPEANYEKFAGFDGAIEFGTFRGKPGITSSTGDGLIVRAHNGWAVLLNDGNPNPSMDRLAKMAELALDATDVYGEPVDGYAPGADWTPVGDDPGPGAGVGDDKPTDAVAGPATNTDAEDVCRAIDPTVWMEFFVEEAPELEVFDSNPNAGLVTCDFVSGDLRIRLLVHYGENLTGSDKGRTIDVDGIEVRLYASGANGPDAGVDAAIIDMSGEGQRGYTIQLRGFSTVEDDSRDDAWTRIVRELIRAWASA